MKFRLFLLALVMCFVATASTQEQVKRPEVIWKPVFGYKNPHSKAYVDINSLDEDGEFVSGALLISFNDSATTMIKGKPLVLKSVVKHIVVNCEKHYLVPVMDFYFDVEKPTRADKPLAGAEYPANIEGALALDKTSPIYKTFCPVYI